MLRLLCVAAVLALAHGQDVNFPCPPGARVTKVMREPWQDDGKLGAMVVECEDFPEPIDADCKPANQSFICDGKLEQCPDGGYIGGLLGFVLEPETGATLLHPICCNTGAVAVDGESCKSKRINHMRSSIDYQAGPDDVITGVRCWQLHEKLEGGRMKLWDFTWKLEQCKMTFDPAGGAGGGGAGGACPPCSCTCEPFECPAGKRAHLLVHKRRRRQACQCVCNCSYECV